MLAPIVLAAAGWIGSMNIAAGNAATVVALYGPPAAEGWFVGGGTYPPSRALGYECTAHRSNHAWPVTGGGPWCRTVFWADPVTGAVGDFFTSSSWFEEEHGVRVGMPTAVAENRFGKEAFGGCSAGMNRGDLTIEIQGGTWWVTPSHALRVIGGHVDSFFLLNPRGELGIFDC
jgi:hypothetical protein